MGRFGAGLISQAEFKILPMEEDLGQCVFAVIRLLRGVTVGPSLFADGHHLRWHRTYGFLAAGDAQLDPGTFASPFNLVFARRQMRALHLPAVVPATRAPT